MALSVLQQPFGNAWPLGFVAVAANGTPVNLMVNVDANNTYGPSNPTTPYTPRCRKIVLQGMKPGNSNNGMIPNTGYVYLLAALGPGAANNNAGGPQNRTDSGAMYAVLPPGGIVVIPVAENEGPGISPYGFTLDSDVNGEGALVTLYNCAR
jgi:hypothetical protein